MKDADPNTPPDGVDVPHESLSREALQGLVEAFVLREGTEYGPEDVRLADKVAAVLDQLERREARIVFDPGSESVDIIPTDSASAHGTDRAAHGPGAA